MGRWEAAARSENEEHFEDGGELQTDEKLDNTTEETNKKTNHNSEEAADELENDSQKCRENSTAILVSILSKSEGTPSGTSLLEDLKNNEDVDLVCADAVAVVASADDELRSNFRDN